MGGSQVGNLRFFCGYRLALGPNAKATLAAHLVMLLANVATFVFLIVKIEDGMQRAISWALLVLSTVIYIWVCLSNPGIPKQIIDASKGVRDSTDTKVDFERDISGAVAFTAANEEKLLKDTICWQCV